MTERARFSHVLRNKNFLFLWLDQLMSQLADRFLLYVLLILAYKFTKSNLGVSLPMLSFGLSAIIFGPAAGVFVDRWNKKMIMIVSNLLRGSLILLIIPFIDQSLLIIFFISFIIFSISQFFGPAEISSIPMLVQKQDLVAANSLFMVSLMAASFIGIGMAVPLLNFFGTKALLIIAASLHLASTLATFMVALEHKRRKIKTVFSDLTKDLIMGFEFIRRRAEVRISLLKMFLAAFALAAVSMLAVGFAEKILKIGAANFGYLVFSSGMGMLIGGLLLGRFSHYFKRNILIRTGFFLAALVMFVLSRVDSLLMVVILTFTLGFCGALVMINLQTVLHERVPGVLRGRIFGVQNMFINSAFTLPVVAIGMLADHIGLKSAITSISMLLVLAGSFDLLLWGFNDV